jgi:hypothetical protein
MASTKKAPTKAKATKPLRGEKAATPKRLDEKTLKTRYADHAIVGGSLRFEAEGTHANKQTVEIVCGSPGCKATRRVATSDLFQVSTCSPCVAVARAERRKARRAAAREAKAAEAD